MEERYEQDHVDHRETRTTGEVSVLSQANELSGTIRVCFAGLSVLVVDDSPHKSDGETPQAQTKN